MINALVPSNTMRFNSIPAECIVANGQLTFEQKFKVLTYYYHVLGVPLSDYVKAVRFLHEYDLSRNAQRAWWRWFLQELECDAGAIAVTVGDIINVPVESVQELPHYLRWHPEHPPNGFIRVPPTLPPHQGPIVPPQPPNDPIGPIPPHHVEVPNPPPDEMDVNPPPVGPIGPPENPLNDELSDASSSHSGFNNPDDSSDSDDSDALDDSDEDSTSSHDEVLIHPPVGPPHHDSGDEECVDDKDTSDTDSTATLTPPPSDTGSQQVHEPPVVEQTKKRKASPPTGNRKKKKPIRYQRMRFQQVGIINYGCGDGRAPFPAMSVQDINRAYY